MVGHHMPFQYFNSLVFTQGPNDFPQIFAVLIVDDFSPVFRAENDVIFAHPFRSVYKELHADHETGAADNK